MNEPELKHKEPSPQEWRAFWTLVAVQAQNAFNEKAVQFLLIPLGVWLWGAADSTLEYVLGAIFVIPYIIFSPIVGWLSDCYCKTRIIQIMSIIQCFVMACMLFCFYQRDMQAAIIWFAVFATQATVLSPAKKGIVKDLLGSKYIAFGSGIIEVSLVFVLLVAQIGVFFLYSYLLVYFSDMPDAEHMAGWRSVQLPTWVFLGLAIMVAALSFILPRYPSLQKRPFSISLFWEHFGQVKYLWKNRELRLSELGISYFWCLASSLFLIIIQIAKDMATQNPGIDFSLQCGILMAWLGGGVITGGTIASVLCLRKNELGLIPLGAIGITISTLLLCILNTDSVASHIMLLCAGAFGAAYLLPLNAYLQDHCDPANRGNIIAAGNLIDNLMGLVAVALMWFIHDCGGNSHHQFFVLFLLSLFIMVTSLRLIPQEFLRMVAIWCMHLAYRPRIINESRIPEQGGALLFVNHVTYADAIFLSMICPRPVRFIVAEEFMASKVLGWILEMFNSLPISSKNPREAIIKAAEGIDNGELICIFPEGQLTRTGCLSPIRRGMEVVARRTKAPIIPIYIDGLWGSIFSYYRNRFFTKVPKRVPYHFTAAIGEPMDHGSFNSELALNVFRKLSATCIESRDGGSKEAILRTLEQIGNQTLVSCKEGSMTGSQIMAAMISHSIPSICPPPIQKWLRTLYSSCDKFAELHRIWMNTTQLRRVNSLREGMRHPLLSSIGNKEPHEVVMAIFWPIMTHTPIHLISSDQEEIPDNITQIVGSSHLRRILYKIFPTRQTPFYDFSERAAMSCPNINWRPCHATVRGCIIAMSMGHGVYKMYDGTIQLGTRPRTRGLLLPGYEVQKNSDGEIILRSPVLSKEYTLPRNLYLDESGFLAELA